MKYSSLTFVIIISTTLLSCSTEKSKKNLESPNIIYVLADDLGYGDLKAFNPNSQIRTPNLDQLASEGICFTDAHSSSSVCTPTRYGILTGRYSWRSTLKQGVLTGRSNALIATSRTTVASLLKQQGYHTAFIGKWHLGWNWAKIDESLPNGEGWNYRDFDNIDFTRPIQNSPNDLGFDYAYGHSGSLDMAPYVYVEDRHPTAVPSSVTENKEKYSFWRKGPTAPDFVHEQVTPNFFNRAIDYIEKRAKSGDPFFLYLPLPSPHTPILPLEEWQNKSGLNPYGDFVMMMDHYMGQLLQAVQDAGIEKNTMIIFTSDNGCSPEANFELLSENGHSPSGIFRGHKSDIYEGGHRVPFIVKWPTNIEAGTKSSELINLNDLMATVASITGYTLQDNEGEDSYDMLPALVGEALTPIRESCIHHSIDGEFAIRKGSWKLIMCPGSGGWSYPNDPAILDTLPLMQLFNLKDDHSERTNLVYQEMEKVEELTALLTDYILSGRSTPGVPQQNDSVRHWPQLWWIN